MPITDKLSDLIREHGITIVSRQGTDDIPEDCKDMDAWTVTLHRGNRSMTVPFFQGTGYHGAEPKVEDVMSSLVLDSSVDGESFESWCGDLGYDTDSRKAEKTYRACRTIAYRLKRFLGEVDYRLFRAAENDL